MKMESRQSKPHNQAIPPKLRSLSISFSSCRGGSPSFKKNHFDGLSPHWPKPPPPPLPPPLNVDYVFFSHHFLSLFSNFRHNFLH